jgi:hypothetical protein
MPSIECGRSIYSSTTVSFKGTAQCGLIETHGDDRVDPTGPWQCRPHCQRKVPIFGVHRTAPFARYDLMGLAVLLDGAEVVAMTANYAEIRTRNGARQRYVRRRSLDPMQVAIWDCGTIAHHVQTKVLSMFIVLDFIQRADPIGGSGVERTS